MVTILMLTDKCRLIPLPNSVRPFVDDYLFVPFELTELEVRVADCLEKRELKRKHPQSKTDRPTWNGDSMNMLGILSHDIRGSALSLSATLELLIRGYYGKMDEGVVSSLKEMLSRTACLAGMTEECLSGISSGHFPIETRGEMLELVRDIIHPVLEELSYDLKRAHIRIDHRLDGIVGKENLIKGSRFWLKAVFRNLLKNAIQYGGDGSTIVLSFEDHRSFYRFNVYNSGKPIPEQYRDKLFSCGSNGNGNGGGHGLGMGLYLTKTIIQNYGGEIWYEAKDDGSNFVFTLPSGVEFSVAPLLPMRSKPFAVAPASMDHRIKDRVQYRHS